MVKQLKTDWKDVTEKSKNKRFKAKRGRKYRSKFEADLAKKMPRVPGVKVVYEGIGIDYTLTRTYRPDWVIYLPDGKIRIVEAKGWFRPEDRQKMLAVKKSNPFLDVKLVLSNQKDAKWCERHGFDYSLNSIPKVWFL